MAFVLGLGLALAVGLGLHYGALVFTSDKQVLHLITIGIPVCISQNIHKNAFIYSFTSCDKSYWKEMLSLFRNQFVAATQPINSLAFVFDGVNYGVSDFAYSAYSMVSY